jgi:AraC-like DNA-binding protein
VWEELATRLLVPLEMWSRNATIDGTIREAASGTVAVSRYTASPHFGIRTEDGIRLRPTPGLMKIAVVMNGSVTVAQGGNRTVLRRGEATAYATWAPYSVGSDTPFDILIALVPLDATGLSGASLIERAALPFDPRASAGLRQMMLGANGLRESGVDLFGDRVNVALSGTNLGSEARQRAERVHDRAIDIIQRRMGTPWLSPDYIADVLGVSRRTLYSAFAGTARGGVASVIRSLRLSHARDLIQRYPDLSIKDAAAESGFTDPAHFTRAYRRAYGEPPSSSRVGGHFVQIDDEDVS